MTDLSRLLSPRTIAVFGGKECERVVEQCDKFGYDGEIWPVHPTRETLRGRPCYRSVEALPGVPDAAYVAVNRARTVDVIAELSALGCGGAVCYAAGFAEADRESAGSAALQARLVAAAGEMPVIGPNCYGFINAIAGAALWPDQHGARRCETGVAIITQSSNIAINLTMQKRALPVAFVMTAGNQAQTGLSEMGLGLLENPNVTALGLHIEGLDDVHAFERLALRARALKKPIVVLKVGKSEQAQAAALTHTASLAGSDIAHRALFRRLGVARVDALDAFLETLKLFHFIGALPGKDIVSLSCSGGEASLMADAGEERTLRFRPYSAAEAAALKAELGEIVTVSNPLDYNTFIWGNWPAMTRMFEAALAPQFDLAMLVMDFPRADTCDDADWRGATDTFVAAVKQTGARAVVVASLPENMPEFLAADLHTKGITTLCGLESAMAAVEASAFVGLAWAAPEPLSLLEPSRREQVSATLANNPDGSADAAQGQPDVVVLNEHQSKQALAAAGVVVPNGMVARNLAEIEQAMTTLQKPLAVKGLGIAHKSEAGAVHLNLSDNAAIVQCIQKMARLTDQFLIEEMSARPLAEVLVGVTRDPVVGMTLTLGAGGVLAELLEDTATLLLPCREDDIRKALSGLRIGRLLEGFRNSDAADIDALIANILCIAQYACDHADRLLELDVNPVFATQFGSVAVDALIVMRNEP